MKKILVAASELFREPWLAVEVVDRLPECVVVTPGKGVSEENVVWAAKRRGLPVVTYKLEGGRVIRHRDRRKVVYAGSEPRHIKDWLICDEADEMIALQQIICNRPTPGTHRLVQIMQHLDKPVAVIPIRERTPVTRSLASNAIRQLAGAHGITLRQGGSARYADLRDAPASRDVRPTSQARR